MAESWKKTECGSWKRTGLRRQIAHTTWKCTWNTSTVTDHLPLHSYGLPIWIPNYWWCDRLEIVHVNVRYNEDLKPVLCQTQGLVLVNVNLKTGNLFPEGYSYFSANKSDTCWHVHNFLFSILVSQALSFPSTPSFHPLLTLLSHHHLSISYKKKERRREWNLLRALAHLWLLLFILPSTGCNICCCLCFSTLQTTSILLARLSPQRDDSPCFHQRFSQPPMERASFLSY